jgi:hypothetical protein
MDTKEREFLFVAPALEKDGKTYIRIGEGEDGEIYRCIEYDNGKAELQDEFLEIKTKTTVYKENARRESSALMRGLYPARTNLYNKQ